MTTTPPERPDAAIRTRILLVEDNDAARQGLAKLLEALGFDVVVRRDGTSALKSLESDLPLDFVLTDLRLPDLDGREIALKASRLVPPPRVALMTGWDLEGELTDYEAWGIDWVFPKPLDLNSLMSRLRESRPRDAQ
jgi:DNA-binding response OmpR family regulator